MSDLRPLRLRFFARWVKRRCRSGIECLIVRTDPFLITQSRAASRKHWGPPLSPAMIPWFDSSS